jgi:hypothetical protein
LLSTINPHFQIHYPSVQRSFVINGTTCNGFFLVAHLGHGTWLTLRPLVVNEVLPWVNQWGRKKDLAGYFSYDLPVAFDSGLGPDDA